MKYPKYSSLVGSKTICRIHSCSILLYQERIFLERRSDNGLWGLIGGRIEIGESPQDAVIREVFEETNIVIDSKKLNLHGVYGDVKDGRIVEYQDSSSHVIDIVFTYELDSKPTITISDESLCVHCFTYDDIPWTTLIKPAAKPLYDFIEMAKGGSKCHRIRHRENTEQNNDMLSELS